MKNLSSIINLKKIVFESISGQYSHFLTIVDRGLLTSLFHEDPLHCIPSLSNSGVKYFGNKMPRLF